jgi:hypothetical protein
MILVDVERLARSYFVVVDGRSLATRLVEETETHVLVGLLLLLLLSGLGCGLLSSTTGGSSSATSSGATTRSARGNGGELRRTLLNELVDVLALKLRNQLVETLVVSLDTDGFKDGLYYCKSLNAGMGGMARSLTLTSAAEGEVFPPRPRRR